MSSKEKINTIINHLKDEFPYCKAVDRYDQDHRAQLFRIDDGKNISLLRIEESFFENRNVSQISMWVNDTNIDKQLNPASRVTVTIDMKGNSRNS
ncbi:MAG: hypothetical protein GY928_32475 [Colwellia sp.]|nr:hypothetical protein [Colwellia sp.]